MPWVGAELIGEACCRGAIHYLKIVLVLIFGCSMKGRHRIPILAAAFMFSLQTVDVPGQTPGEAGAQQSEQLLRQEQERLRREERDRLMRELERSLEVIEPPKPEAQEQKPKSTTCFTINRIELRGADNLLQEEKQALVRPYIGRCLTVEDIDALRVEIDRFYIEKGWIMSRAYLQPKQNIKDGLLIFIILEGTLDSIELNKNEKSDQRQVTMAFPDMVGESVYIRDIEQGLEQMNRLASNRAKMSIGPVEGKPGYSKIIIQNQPDNPYRVLLGYDNQGSESTGEKRGRLTLDLDNPLSVNDHWYLTASDYTGPERDERDSSSYDVIVSIPFGYWTYDLSFSHSEYLSTVQSAGAPFSLTGTSDTGTLKASRVVHRSKYTKTSVGGALSLKDTESFLEDVRLETSSRKLTVFDLSVLHVVRKPGVIWSFLPAYSRGLDTFGALEDGPTAGDDIPKAQFEKIKWDISASMLLPALGPSWSYRGVLSGQLSRDPLFGSEQISIGSLYTVRGFRESPAAGDSGVYLRNDLTWIVPDRFRLLRNLSLLAGLDVGYVNAKNDNIANSGEADATLIGYAIGAQQTIRFG